MKTKFATRLAAVVMAGSSLFASAALAERVSSLTQYGVSWTFQSPAEVGQFINGDYWVVGPVQIQSVSPGPGSLPNDSTAAIKNKFGDDGLQSNPDMRNGSMVVNQLGRSQAYDSRLRNFDASLGVRFPYDLKPNESLISTISNESVDVPNFAADLMWAKEKRSRIVLKSAAVLTCLPAAPPKDAFRPAYAGTTKTIYRADQLRWDRLPALKPAGVVPDWALIERYLQRPWLDHVPSWLVQMTGPSDNQPSYGREFSRIVSIASLMVSLDVSQERKKTLTIELVQLGIDMHGLMLAGRTWSADGGHWSGRKWPILFAGLMLNDPAMQTLPATAIFQEDQQTYYGRGWAGQTALFQMGSHHGPRQPYEEKPPAQWDAMDKRSESYRLSATARAWIGTALTAQFMNAKEIWNHDAYFDYCDRWMAKTDAYADGRQGIARPKEEGSTFDPFVDAIWAAHRAAAPTQKGATAARKWVWTGGGKGQFVDNTDGR